jgi:hypothetical protein
MAKSAGKGTTVSVSATVIGANLVKDVHPFQKTINTDDITAIDSAAEARAGSLPSWSAARVTAFWDKSDTSLGVLQAAGETTELAIILTFPDLSTQTATCIVTQFQRGGASRRGRLEVNIELTPVDAVTEATGT